MLELLLYLYLASLFFWVGYLHTLGIWRDAGTTLRVFLVVMTPVFAPVLLLATITMLAMFACGWDRDP